jgi:hypothetical protein
MLRETTIKIKNVNWSVNEVSRFFEKQVKVEMVQGFNKRWHFERFAKHQLIKLVCVPRTANLFSWLSLFLGPVRFENQTLVGVRDPPKSEVLVIFGYRLIIVLYPIEGLEFFKTFKVKSWLAFDCHRSYDSKSSQRTKHCSEQRWIIRFRSMHNIADTIDKLYFLDHLSC